ncbi:MAG: nucleotidyltransferase domain-containing protein [Treponema sp.]|jgi:predicted nucleotidyltransferase|nr:nucleotidyltransferase domain-containing protein [Treponema sp.]
MRITEDERKVLIDAVHKVDADAQIWLFGSRVDDTKKGGDIDIAILSRRLDRLGRMSIRRSVTDRLGERQIDIVVSADGSEPFFRLAIETGVLIDG